MSCKNKMPKCPLKTACASVVLLSSLLFSATGTPKVRSCQRVMSCHVKMLCVSLHAVIEYRALLIDYQALLLEYLALLTW